MNFCEGSTLAQTPLESIAVTQNIKIRTTIRSIGMVAYAYDREAGVEGFSQL